MLFLHLQHSSASSSGGSGWLGCLLQVTGGGSTAMHRAGYRASEKGRFRCSSHAGVCTPSAAEELVAALVRGGRASEEEALLRGERHTREMRVTRECTSSGLRAVDCGLWTAGSSCSCSCSAAAAAAAHARWPGLCDGDGNSAPEQQWRVSIRRTYIHIHSLHNQVCVWASEHFTHIHTHTHAHTRRTPAPSLQVSLAPGFTSAASSIKQERA